MAGNTFKRASKAEVQARVNAIMDKIIELWGYPRLIAWIMSEYGVAKRQAEYYHAKAKKQFDIQDEAQKEAKVAQFWKKRRHIEKTAWERGALGVLASMNNQDAKLLGLQDNTLNVDLKVGPVQPVYILPEKPKDAEKWDESWDADSRESE
jgi:hypothetical protein